MLGFLIVTLIFIGSLVGFSRIVDIQKVKDNPQLPPMWQNHCTLINSKGEMIGKINHAEQTMTLFVIEECLNQHKE